LKGIRGRVTVQKQHRNKHSNWAFGQLRGFLSYKAKRAGIPVIIVDPQNTSRECSQCGWTASSNRKSRSRFECSQCGHCADADLNAALNIRARGVVSRPIVSAGFAR
jgi:transposase